MKTRKYLVVAALVVAVAALALVGCSSGGSSSSAASSKSSANEIKLVKEGTLTVATSPDFPPFENRDTASGDHVGLDVEIAKAVAKELGYEIEFKALDFEDIIPAIAAGGQADMGISGLTIDPERAKEVDFTDSYYTDDLSFAVMKGSTITKANVDTEINKESVTVAVQAGTSGETYVKQHYPNATLKPYKGSAEMFAAVQSEGADVVCTNKAVVAAMIADTYQDMQVVKRVPASEDYGIVVSKDNPALLKAVNNALAKLKDNGTIDKLVQDHIERYV